MVAVHGNKIEIAQSLRFDVKLKWEPQVHKYTPSIEEVGIENMRISTPKGLYRGHEQEIGFNGLYFYTAFNCWAKNISFIDTENAGCIESSKFCEMSNIKVYGGERPRTDFVSNGKYGHHGICIGKNSCDNVLSDFYVYDNYFHDVTLSHNCNGNVIRRMISCSASIDYHKYAPYENLWVNVNLGLGTEAWICGGNVTHGPHTAARATFWNVKSKIWEKTSPPDWGYIQTNIIPANTTLKTTDREWYEDIDDLTPDDIYVSQQIKRNGYSLAGNDIMTPMIHPKPGQYRESINVMILAVSPEDEIRYTLDGSEPDKNSFLYENSFSIDVHEKSYKIKARVFRGDESSETAFNLYEPDNILPEILSVDVLMSNQLKIHFSEPIDTLTAQSIANYTIDNNVNVKSCTVIDLDAVSLLTEEDFSSGLDYKITFNDIEDLVGNKILENTEYPFDFISVTLVASSSEAANPPENTIDKNLNTRWSSQGVGEWIKFDLGATKIVDYVDMSFYKGDERSTFFSIEVSIDNIEWEEVFDGNATGTSTELERFFFSPVYARYVKIIGKGNNSSNPNSIMWNSITEIDIHKQNIINTSISTSNGSISIYPNPVSNGNICIGIQNLEKDQNFSLLVLDMTGKTVLSKMVNCNGLINKKLHINIDKLKSGPYLLKLSSSTTIFHNLFIVN